MMRITLAMGFLILLVTVSFQNAGAAPATASPVDVTNALLHTALKHFGFAADSLKLEKEWIAPDLYARLLKKANEPVAKGDAPDIEGDIFLNSQETPTKVKVGNAIIDQDKAKVDVVLNFDEEKMKYTVLLKQVDGAWKVYDVNYGKDGFLTDLLK
jgi:hypothetical protein